jgi:hypothetical protein
LVFCYDGLHSVPVHSRESSAWNDTDRALPGVTWRKRPSSDTWTAEAREADRRYNNPFCAFTPLQSRIAVAEPQKNRSQIAEGNDHGVSREVNCMRRFYAKRENLRAAGVLARGAHGYQE